MPILLRFVVVAVIAFLAGSTVTPLLWQPVLVKQSQDSRDQRERFAETVFYSDPGE